MNNTKGNFYSSENTDIRDIIDFESIDLYSDKEEVLRKWLKNYGLLSVEGDYKRNKECLTQVFNLLDIISVIKVEELIKINNTPKIYEDNKTYIELFYNNKTRKIAISSSFHNRIYALECYGCKLPKDLNSVLRIVRNNTTHGSETVVKEYIDLSYDRTVGYMELMEPQYKYPDFNDLRVHISSTLQDGNYIIKNKIGEGGTSRVYLSEQKKLNRKLAIKELKPYAYTAELLQNEIDVMLSIHHAQIPHVYDAFYENKTYYIVMDYIDGITLNKYCKETELSERQKLVLSKNILDIISYLHSEQIDLILVDLKPENIIVGRDGKPYLIDFGIAQGRDGKVINGFSDEYSAPEIAKGFRGTKLSDIYSVGKVIEFIYSDGGTADYINSDVREVIDKCIADNPDKRYSSVEDVSIALDECYNSNKKSKKKANNSAKKSSEKPVQNVQPPANMPIQPVQPPVNIPVQPAQPPVSTPAPKPANKPVKKNNKKNGKKALLTVFLTVFIAAFFAFDVWLIFKIINDRRGDKLSENNTEISDNEVTDIEATDSETSQTTVETYTDENIADYIKELCIEMESYCQNDDRDSFDSLFVIESGDSELINERYNYIKDVILPSGYNNITAYKICKNGKYYYVGYYIYKDADTASEADYITQADIFTDVDGELKIVVKDDSLSEITEKILSLLYPEAQAAINAGRNYYSQTIENGDFSWCSDNVVIQGTVCSDVFLIWQNEDGSVDIYLNVKNGTDEELNISGIDITLTNTSNGTEETVIQHSFGGASISANESKNLHGHIEALGCFFAANFCAKK